MPRYYCDYCDTYLTHDSPSVRKQHNAGYKHKANVRDYYQKFLDDQNQSLADQQMRGLAAAAAAFPPIGLAALPHGMRPPMGLIHPGQLQNGPPLGRPPVLPMPGQFHGFGGPPPRLPGQFPGGPIGGPPRPAGPQDQNPADSTNGPTPGSAPSAGPPPQGPPSQFPAGGAPPGPGFGVRLPGPPPRGPGGPPPFGGGPGPGGPVGPMGS